MWLLREGRDIALYRGFCVCLRFSLKLAIINRILWIANCQKSSGVPRVPYGWVPGTGTSPFYKYPCFRCHYYPLLDYYYYYIWEMVKHHHPKMVDSSKFLHLCTQGYSFYHLPTFTIFPFEFQVSIPLLSFITNWLRTGTITLLLFI